MTRAVGYVRVSTDRQDYGAQAQREAIGAWCAANGATLEETHEDLGVSGAAPLGDCPGLMSALRSLKRGSVLVVAKRDRIGRDTLRCLLVEREAGRKGASVVSADGNGNGDSAEAKMLRGILNAVAEYERALISARTKSAMRSMQGRGLAAGGVPPYGWSKVGKALVVEPIEAGVLALARGQHEAGETWTAIAKHLDRAGYVNRDGRPWSAKAIRRTVFRSLGRATA